MLTIREDHRYAALTFVFVVSVDGGAFVSVRDCTDAMCTVCVMPK